MNSHQTHLIVIAAPSGAGKTTLCQMLLCDFDALSFSISSTTRAPRGNEKNGVDYFFLTQDEFEKQIQENRFAEWAKVHGNYYGTSKEMIQKAFSAHQSVLLDIDVQGAEQIKNAFPQECHRFFIAPPNLTVLEARLRMRGTDSEEMIQKRLKNAKIEIEAGYHFEHFIINDKLEKAYLELKTILETQYLLKLRK